MRKNTNAAANIYGNGISGRVLFKQLKNGVVVTANIEGLPSDGFFAFHIHEGGSCQGDGFSDTGAHYNPTEKPHPMHAGDMPPLLSSNKKAYLSFLTNRFKVSEIIGKTVVIHSGVDDFTSQPAGNAGTKIACGVIR